MNSELHVIILKLKYEVINIYNKFIYQEKEKHKYHLKGRIKCPYCKKFLPRTACLKAATEHHTKN